VTRAAPSRVGSHTCHTFAVRCQKMKPLSGCCLLK
jgi:hypothetical protein